MIRFHWLGARARTPYISICVVLCIVTGCKNPFDRTKDASGGGGTGTISGAKNLIIFNDELVSGGGAFEYPGGENQTLSFSDTSNPISRRSIRYSWTGAPAQLGGTDHTFAGFDLMHTNVLSLYASTAGRDLRKAGYMQVTFYARGSLSTNTVLKIEVSDDGDTSTATPCMTLSVTGSSADDVCSATGPNPNPLAMPTKILTSSWQAYFITVPTSSQAQIKDFFKATFVYTDPLPGVPNQLPGQGGTAYFDKIQYQP